MAIAEEDVWGTSKKSSVKNPSHLENLVPPAEFVQEDISGKVQTKGELQAVPVTRPEEPRGPVTTPVNKPIHPPQPTNPSDYLPPPPPDAEWFVCLTPPEGQRSKDCPPFQSAAHFDGGQVTCPKCHSEMVTRASEADLAVVQ